MGKLPYTYNETVVTGDHNEPLTRITIDIDTSKLDSKLRVEVHYGDRVHAGCWHGKSKGVSDEQH